MQICKWKTYKLFFSYSLQHARSHLPLVQVSLDVCTSSRDGGLSRGGGGFRVRHVCGGAATWCWGCVSCPVLVLWTPMDPSATNGDRQREKVETWASWWKGRGAQREVGGDKTCERGSTRVYSQELREGAEEVKGQWPRRRRFFQQGQKRHSWICIYGFHHTGLMPLVLLNKWSNTSVSSGIQKIDKNSMMYWSDQCQLNSAHYFCVKNQKSELLEVSFLKLLLFCGLNVCVCVWVCMYVCECVNE